MRWGGRAELPALPELRSRAPAFTLLELLVALAIISLVVGLTLPAIQRVREAANRTRCANSLKQYALACHSCEAATGRFPAGGGAAWESSGGRWLYDIRGHVEDYSVGYGRVRIDCPSKIGVGLYPPVYAALDFDQAGIIGLGERGIAAAWVTDGVSNTAMITELWTDQKNMSWCTWIEADKRYTSNVFRSSRVPLARDGDASGSIYGAGAVHAALPVAFGDGSVRWIGFDVNTLAWKAVGTRAGGESLECW